MGQLVLMYLLSLLADALFWMVCFYTGVALLGLVTLGNFTFTSEDGDSEALYCQQVGAALLGLAFWIVVVVVIIIFCR